MLLCNSWKMKCFNGSKTWEITWNDPFAILRFPLSKLVFNSLWNDNNFFRAFLLLYTIFKERLNLKPKKKQLCFSVWSFYCHWASSTLFQYSILSILTHCLLVSGQKNDGTFNWPQPILINILLLILLYKNIYEKNITFSSRCRISLNSLLVL